MGFSRQGYWSGLPFPSPGVLPDPEIEPPTLQADALPSEPSGTPRYYLFLYPPVPGNMACMTRCHRYPQTSDSKIATGWVT